VIELLKTRFPMLELPLLEELSQVGKIRNLQAGDELIKIGQYIRSTVLVVGGSIKVFRESEEGGEFLVYYLKSGNACAISMICAMKSDTSEVSAIATEDSEVLLVPLELMDSWMMRYTSWNRFVLGNYRERFEELLQVIDQIAFRSLDERLEFHLKRLADNAGSLTIQASHQDIANDLNSSREVISRLLKKMEQKGLLSLQRNQIHLNKQFGLHE
jgi:CRP/FNR family transcriptional regulator